MVDQATLQGHWNEIKGKLKEKWGTLRDDDVAIFNGNVDQLVGRIQQRTGETRQAVEHYLEQIVDEGSSLMGRAQEAVQQAAEQVRETAGQVRDSLSQGYASTEGMVQARPGQSMLVVFGCGVLAGLGIAVLMREREPDSSSRGKNTAEYFGRQMMDALAASVPESLASRFRS